MELHDEAASCRMSPKATGVLVRIVNRTGHSLDKLRLAIRSLDTDGSPPIIHQAQESTGVFDRVTVLEDSLVLSGGTLEAGRSCLLDLQFLEEVGGHLGAELITLP